MAARHEDDRAAQHREQGRARNAERAHPVAQRIDGRDVEERVADDDGERALDQRPPMILEDRRERDRDPVAGLERGAERGRLLERYAHIEADRDQRGAEQERDAPAPGDEGLPRQSR